MYNNNWPVTLLGVIFFYQQSRKMVSRYKWDINEDKGINTYSLCLYRAVYVRNDSASLLGFLIFVANLAEFWAVFLGFHQHTLIFPACLCILNQGINIYHLGLYRAFSVRNHSALYPLFWVLDVFDAHVHQLWQFFVFSSLY